MMTTRQSCVGVSRCGHSQGTTTTDVGRSLLNLMGSCEGHRSLGISADAAEAVDVAATDGLSAPLRTIRPKRIEGTEGCAG